MLISEEHNGNPCPCLLDSFPVTLGLAKVVKEFHSHDCVLVHFVVSTTIMFSIEILLYLLEGRLNFKHSFSVDQTGSMCFQSKFLLLQYIVVSGSSQSIAVSF